MRFTSVAIAAFAVISATGAARATTFTVDFHEVACSNTSLGSQIDAGPVSYSNNNTFNYGQCNGEVMALQDNDFRADGNVTAAPGLRFDLLGFDIAAAWLSLYGRPMSDLTGDYFADENTLYDTISAAYAVATYPFLILTGYRDGAVVATDSFDPVGMSGYTASGAFSDLDRVDFDLAFYGPNDVAWVSPYTGNPNDTRYACYLGCGGAIIDNVRIDVTPVEVAQTPLPAGFGMLFAALLGMGFLGLRQRRTVKV